MTELKQELLSAIKDARLEFDGYELDLDIEGMTLDFKQYLINNPEKAMQAKFYADVPARSIELFSEDQIVEFGKRSAGAGSEELERAKRVMKSFLDNGHERKFSIPQKDFSAQLDLLIQEQPNFEEVIEMNVRPSLSILAVGGVARPAPALLLGPPGVGKTFFAEQLAKIINAPNVKIDMASAQTGAGISGTSSFWSNTKPGQVFNSLIYGASGFNPAIDPLIFLDEVDKANTHHGHDPLSGLYSLLEIESAKRFEDESVPGLQLNASYIRWIMAANNIDSIPAPIKSRCQIFEIPELTATQKREAFTRTFKNVVKSCEIDFFDQIISPRLIEQNISMGMREFKTLSIIAIGKALCDGRSIVLSDDFSTPTLSQKTGIGFFS